MVDRLNIATFEPKIIPYLRRLGLEIHKLNHNRKTRLFSNETVDYFTCQLELSDQQFRRNERIEKKITHFDLQKVQPEMLIANEKMRDFFNQLKMREING